MLPRPSSIAPALATTFALAGVLLASPPAHADVVGSTSSRDAVLTNRCAQHPVRYSFDVGPGTASWRAKIALVSPSGTTSEGVDLSSLDGSPTSGRVRFLLCGSDEPGTYTVHTTGSYQTVPAVNQPIRVADSTFRVRRTTTRTTLGVTRLGTRRFELSARVADPRRHGFSPTESAEVLFQRRVAGHWRVIRGSRSLTDHGLATYVVTAAAGTRVRAVTAHAGYLRGSRSPGRVLR